ncbi:ARM repeat-containing protein [Neocallimastix lanati (nom. inval.)]|uniref:Nucleolar protein 9 n=1 Tax=Neocallimastix californiae TaxID=1754190 RepID=A0A1Y2D5W0_9FUNG|nr:ARM repeat-containing protein [Neocallimastix sp. JGI-2020a]ORY54671.1 ARM repeat-containing protein [Neocallimastix californiae]|eukprot:ORY54671.1 ARM repeat-containing protein [Neocallimastix californiae]
MPHERRRKTRRAKKQKSVEEKIEEQQIEGENLDYSQENQYENENYESEKYDNVDNKKKLFDVNNWDNDVQAHYGRPSPDILQYFSNIEKMLSEQEFEDEEEHEMFLNNIYKEIDGNELQLATDKECSRIMEKILKVSNDAQIRVFLNQLNEKYIELFTHRYGSHVCQTILVLGSDIIEREIKGESVIMNSDDNQNPPPTMQELVVKMCNILEDYWIHLISNQFGSHLLRVILMILSGQYVTLESNEVRSKKSKQYNAKNNVNFKNTEQNLKRKRLVPDSFKDILNNILEKLTKDMGPTELHVFCVNSIANPVLQYLVKIQYENGSESIINNIFNTKEDGSIEKDNFVNDLLKHPVGSHLFEKMLKYCSDKMFHNIFITYFHGRLVELSRNNISNFVVQHLLENVRSSQQLQIMIKEIISEFEFFLFRGRSGVVVKAVEACGKHKVQQKEIVNAINKAFHVTNESRKTIIKLLLTLKKYEDYIRDSNAPYLIQGALMIETLLSFEDGNNKFLIESLINLSHKEIKEWAIDAIASRVIESFLLSSQVLLKAKRKILHMFDGNYGEIACNRYGSHLVDKCWAVSDLKMKESIAEELLENERELNSNFHGKFVLRNCKIENFKRNRQEWIEHEHGLERKKQMFEELLNDSTDTKTQNKSSNNEEDTDVKSTNILNSALSALGFDKGLSQTTSKDKKNKNKKKKKTENVINFLFIYLFNLI